MLAGKFATRAGALITGVRLRDHHAIWRSPRTLAFTPNQFAAVPGELPRLLRDISPGNAFEVEDFADVYKVVGERMAVRLGRTGRQFDKCVTEPQSATWNTTLGAASESLKDLTEVCLKGPSLESNNATSSSASSLAGRQSTSMAFASPCAQWIQCAHTYGRRDDRTVIRGD